LRIFPGQATFFLGLVILKFVAARSYIESIVPYYGYYGFKFFAPDFFISILNWGFFLICGSLLTSLVRRECVSAWIISLLFCISYIPCLVYFELSDKPFIYFAQLHTYWFLLIFFLSRLPVVKFSSSLNSLSALSAGRRAIFGDFIIIILALYVFVVKYAHNGFYIHLDIVDVYGLRAEASDKNLGLGANYFISWSCLAFTIRGVVAYNQSRYFILIFLIMMQVVIFSISAHKFYLFSLPIAIMASALYRRGSLLWVPFLIAASLLVGDILNTVADFFYLIFALAFRNMFLPALITGNFYDFFASHSPDYLTQSVMGRLGFDSEYTVPIPYLIDSVYGYGDASANTGLSADAVSNFGFFGVIIFPLMFSVTLKLLDSATLRVDLRNNLGIVIFFTIAFLNTAFFTALLTGGVLFSLFFLGTQVPERLRHLINLQRS